MMAHQACTALPEIAINIQGKPVGTKGGKIFVPITIYENGKLVRGGFIPLKAVKKWNDGELVYDKSENGLHVYVYQCNQSRASEKQSFRSAVKKIMSKKVKHV
jgi:hypothetical protein